MLKDSLVAIRTIAARPAYAIAVIVTLAIGISASTMMFSLVDAALLRPLPFAQPDRLVVLTGVAGPQRSPRGASFPEIADWRRLNGTLQDVALYDEMRLNLRVGEEAVRVEAELVSPSYFPLLGIAAARGRTFRADEDVTAGAHAVAVVSHRFWRERLGGDSVPGRTALVNDIPLEIVGVMPEGFAGISFDTDIWIPSTMVTLESAPAIVQDRGSRQFLALGRLKDGVAPARAQEDLTRVATILEQEFPATNRERGVDLALLHASLLGGTASQVTSLFGAVLLFLAVACANAAGLQLVRALSRRRELALRLALGARRSHVLRQLLVESSLLSLTAGGIGAIGAAAATNLTVALTPAGALPAHVVPTIDLRTLAFTFGVSLLVGLVVALVASAAALRANVSDVLKQGGRAVEGGLGAIRRPSLQQILVAVEIAAAMVLLTLAGLVARSLDRQAQVRLGLEPAGVTVARLTLPTARYPPAQRADFVERLDRELRGVPRVQSVAVASDLPLTGVSSAGIMLPDVAATPDGALRYYRHVVTPEFFSTFGIPIVAGRAFTALDRRGAPAVAIVNQDAARRIWGDGDPIGRRFRLGRSTDAAPIEVVGISATVRYRDLTTDLAAAGAEPDVYFPYGQVTSNDLQIAVKTTDGEVVPIGALQRAVAQIDGGVPIYQVRQMADVVRQQTAAPRFVSTLLGVFSAGALLLAAIGLYGLIAYVIGLSRGEIAIRLALGAHRATIVGLVLRNGMAVGATGIALGLVGSLIAGRAIQTQLFQTGGADPGTLAMVAGTLIAVTLLASVVPTRHAIRVDPQRALRGE